MVASATRGRSIESSSIGRVREIAHDVDFPSDRWYQLVERLHVVEGTGIGSGASGMRRLQPGCHRTRQGSEVEAMRCNRVLWGVWQVDRPGPVDGVDGANEGAVNASA
jgi:hypothetical protein